MAKKFTRSAKTGLTLHTTAGAEARLANTNTLLVKQCCENFIRIKSEKS